MRAHFFVSMRVRKLGNWLYAIMKRELVCCAVLKLGLRVSEDWSGNRCSCSGSYLMCRAPQSGSERATRVVASTIRVPEFNASALGGRGALQRKHV